MKGRSSNHARRRQGFTLTEVMITMALVLIVLATVLSCHLFGMRLFEVTKAKLGASDEARGAISTLISEIRSAKKLRIGSGTLASFAEVIPNQPQVGNAIQIYPTINTNSFIRYFWDSTDQKLKRATNDAAEAYVVAHSISNQIVFTAEDYAGQVLTNNDNNRVIGLSLQFYQLQYPAVSIGPGNHYDYYQLRTKITRRAP
jgi:prepilin-type N-terminal cleavage/methylation domain